MGIFLILLLLLTAALAMHMFRDRPDKSTDQDDDYIN